MDCFAILRRHFPSSAIIQEPAPHFDSAIQLPEANVPPFSVVDVHDQLVLVRVGFIDLWPKPLLSPSTCGAYLITFVKERVAASRNDKTKYRRSNQDEFKLRVLPRLGGYLGLYGC
jgi:hypothetical protein